MNSKQKGNEYERRVAAFLQNAVGRIFGEFTRDSHSGAWQSRKSEQGGDLLIPNDFPFSVECKNQKAVHLFKWMEQAEGETPDGKYPILILHKHRSSKDYVLIELPLFLRMIWSLWGNKSSKFLFEVGWDRRQDAEEKEEGK